ncbi:MAG: SPOR domain-containing protein [Bacteroidales bacterium]|nr:SPOR domain-containing protein [Bacteroidales bacterium]
MKVLIQHIESLLPDHDCVVVPGLGGFVQNIVPARYDSGTDFFYPEGKEVCFNSRLTFNDGFLAQAYQESFGLSFEESNLQIREGVQKIKNKIDEGKYLSLGRIGVLWKNEEGQVVFRSENQNFFFPESYGLTSFSFTCIEKRRQHRSYTENQVRKRQENEFINIRLRRNSLRNFATGVAACLFMVLLSKPAGNLPETNNQEASMVHDYLVPAELAPKTVAEEEPAIFKETTSTVKEETKTPEKSTVKIATTIAADVKPTAKTAATVAESDQPTAVKTQVSESVRTYYIVISSFPQKDLAQKWLQTKSREDMFKYLGIVEKDGRARVYARSFSDKDVAQAFLNQFRANNPKYVSAWLLSVKNS